MSPLQKPGEIPARPGEYIERGKRGGKVPSPSRGHHRNRATSPCHRPKSQVVNGNAPGHPSLEEKQDAQLHRQQERPIQRGP